MMRKILSALLGLIHDGVMFLLLVLAMLAAVFAPGVRKYILSRANVFSLRKKLRSVGREGLTFFFCSSIGDFEQTLPLISEIENRQIPYFIFLHSANGYNYAGKLGYRNISFTPLEFFTVWNIIFLSSRPDVCVINRHEFWPGFIITATAWSKLYIINAVQKDKRNPLESLLEQWVYRNSKKVFFVNHIKAFAKNELQTGDTRSDRLKQRHLSEEADCNVLKTQYRSGTEKILVMGNAYADDVGVLQAARDKYPELLNRWKVLIVPSRPEMAGKITAVLGDITGAAAINVIPVMGKLFQYYSCADLAWVGGGFSPAGIHNTLEPSFFNINLISGPNLDNQPDAVMFRKRSALTTFNSVEELHGLLSREYPETSAATIAEMPSPTSLIVKEIFLK